MSLKNELIAINVNSFVTKFFTVFMSSFIVVYVNSFMPVDSKILQVGLTTVVESILDTIVFFILSFISHTIFLQKSSRFLIPTTKVHIQRFFLGPLFFVVAAVLQYVLLFFVPLFYSILIAYFIATIISRIIHTIYLIKNPQCLV